MKYIVLKACRSMSESCGKLYNLQALQTLNRQGTNGTAHHSQGRNSLAYRTY